MIVVTPHADGFILAVRAQPGSRRPGVQGEQGGALKVAVSATATDGKANKALGEALAEALGVRKSQVELLRGHTSRQKQFLIRGVAGLDLKARLALLLGGS